MAIERELGVFDGFSSMVENGEQSKGELSLI